MQCTNAAIRSFFKVKKLKLKIRSKDLFVIALLSVIDAGIFGLLEKFSQSTLFLVLSLYFYYSAKKLSKHEMCDSDSAKDRNEILKDR